MFPKTHRKFISQIMTLLCFYLAMLIATAEQYDGSDEEAWEWLLEKGVHEQEIRQNLTEASHNFSRVYASNSSTAWGASEALARDVICRLGMNQVKEARLLFLKLQEEYSHVTMWLDYAKTKVPDAFLRRPFEWEENTCLHFEWRTLREDQWLGRSVIHAQETMRNDVPCWKVSIRIISAELQRFIEVYYDMVFMDPVFTRIRSIQWEEWERPWLPESIVLQQHPDMGDAELVGLMLGQYPLGLGYELHTEWFDAAEGGLVPATLEVPSLELLQLEGESRTPSYRVVVESYGNERQFWFAQREGNPLMRVQQGQAVARLVKQERQAANVSRFLPCDWFAVPLPDQKNSRHSWYVLSSDTDTAGWIHLIHEKEASLELLVNEMAEAGFREQEAHRFFFQNERFSGWRSRGEKQPKQAIYAAAIASKKGVFLIMIAPGNQRFSEIASRLDLVLGTVPSKAPVDDQPDK